MAREIPIASAFRQLMGSRFRNTVYGDFKNILDTILPVQVIGRDFSDVERPAWGISCRVGPFVGEFPSASLSSAQDVAVEAMAWQIWSPTSGVYWAGPIVVLTPPDSYVPFLNNGLEWTAGIRPRIEFDTGRTRLFSGSNPAFPPFWGLRLDAHSMVTPVQQPMMSWHRFNPPIILPATMFLTASALLLGGELWFSFLYREIG